MKNGRIDLPNHCGVGADKTVMVLWSELDCFIFVAKPNEFPALWLLPL